MKSAASEESCADDDGEKRNVETTLSSRVCRVAERFPLSWPNRGGRATLALATPSLA